MNSRRILNFFEEAIHTERYASMQSPIHAIDPRLKLFSLLAIACTAISIRGIVAQLLLATLLVLMAFASRISMRYFLLRATFFIPIFAGIIALPTAFISPVTSDTLMKFDILGVSLAVSKGGLERAITFVAKVWVCSSSLILLTLTTKLDRIAQALKRLKLPDVIASMLIMTHRYTFLLVEEIDRMILAREARTVGKRTRLELVRWIGSILGSLFIRAYERGERVHAAMLARGYSGKFLTRGEMKSKSTDWCFLLSIVLVCGLALWVDVFV